MWSLEGWPEARLAEQTGPENRGAVTNMDASSKIVTDALALAEQISRAFLQSGYLADFSRESLKEVDEFFDDQVEWKAQGRVAPFPRIGSASICNRRLRWRGYPSPQWRRMAG